jgi:hypothetical protein
VFSGYKGSRRGECSAVHIRTRNVLIKELLRPVDAVAKPERIKKVFAIPAGITDEAMDNSDTLKREGHSISTVPL